MIIDDDLRRVKEIHVHVSTANMCTTRRQGGAFHGPIGGESSVAIGEQIGPAASVRWVSVCGPLAVRPHAVLSCSFLTLFLLKKEIR